MKTSGKSISKAQKVLLDTIWFSLFGLIAASLVFIFCISVTKYILIAPVLIFGFVSFLHLVEPQQIYSKETLAMKLIHVVEKHQWRVGPVGEALSEELKSTVTETILWLLKFGFVMWITTNHFKGNDILLLLGFACLMGVVVKVLQNLSYMYTLLYKPDALIKNEENYEFIWRRADAVFNLVFALTFFVLVWF